LTVYLHSTFQEQAQDAAKTVKRFGNVEQSLRGGLQFYTDLQVEPLALFCYMFNSFNSPGCLCSFGMLV